MSILPSKRSHPGTNGQEETQQTTEEQKTPDSLESNLLPPSEDSEQQPEVAPVAEDSGKEYVPRFRSGMVFLSEADRKLYRQMNKSIAQKLGLNPRSRSFRV